jgi:TonB family protein
MSKRKNDIERYLRGEMTAAEMHELEKAALTDPFLSEALEGAQHAGADSFLFDLKELRSSFQHRTRRHKPQIISMWKWSLGIAAGLVLIAASSVYIIINIGQEKRPKTLASNQDATAVKPVEPAEKKTQMDSAAASQQLSLNTPPRQKISSADEKASGPEKKPTLPAPARPSSRELSDAAENKPLAATEAVAPASQPVAEAEAEEASKEIVSRKDADQRAKADAIPSAGLAKRNDILIVRGKVTSEEDGVVIPGVNILIKGTPKGTVTDIHGDYEIALDDPKQKLLFSFIGYKMTEAAPGNNRELNVQLKTDNLALSEVVVTGAGASEKNEYPTFELAEPKGGREAFRKYLESSIRYPQPALQNKIEGRVVVQFTVGANSELDEFKVLKGIGSGCEEELIRIIKEGPAWSPTRQNNQPVSDKVKIRFKFDIPE